jgi:hypothetical protein
MGQAIQMNSSPGPAPKELFVLAESLEGAVADLEGALDHLAVRLSPIRMARPTRDASCDYAQMACASPLGVTLSAQLNALRGLIGRIDDLKDDLAV